MTIGKWFVAAGLTVQLVGVCISVWGLRLRWTDKRRDERFLEPLTRRLTGARVGIIRFVRRLIRRPGPVVIEVGGATSVATAGQAEFSLGYRPIPEDLELAEALAAVNVQLDRFNTATNDVRRQVNNETRRAEAAERDLETALAGRIEQAAEHERALTVRGIRWEAIGFALITLGAIFQATGALL